MTAIQLYKFIKENEIEYHWIKENTDVLLFVDIRHLKEWNELLGSGVQDEEGITCVMKFGCICFYMDDICQYFNFELTEFFEPEKARKIIK